MRIDELTPPRHIGHEIHSVMRSQLTQMQRCPHGANATDRSAVRQTTQSRASAAAVSVVRHSAALGGGAAGAATEGATGAAGAAGAGAARARHGRPSSLGCWNQQSARRQSAPNLQALGMRVGGGRGRSSASEWAKVHVRRVHWRP